MHLGVQLPAIGEGLSEPWVDFGAYVRLARAAERGLFDFLLVVEGSGAGDSGAAGAAGYGPEPLTVLSALAGVTEHIGLAAAVTTAGREPDQLVRRFAALDQLSAGRAGGPEFVARFTVPRSPQGRPVVIQEDGDPAAEVVLADGREWTRPGVKVLSRFEFTLTEVVPPNGPAGQPAGTATGPAASWTAGRAVGTEPSRGAGREPGRRTGRERGRGAGVETGPESGWEPGRRTGRGTGPESGGEAGRRTGPETGREAHQRSGPGPRGEAGRGTGPEAGAATADQPGPEATLQAGPADALAALLDARVQAGDVDGYVLLPDAAAGGRGLDAFVDRVVPLLQQRGSLRTAYRGTTLREHLGLPRPAWKA